MPTKLFLLITFVFALVLMPSLVTGAVEGALVARYTFDANDANDSSGLGNNGTVVNGASVIPDAGGGIKGASLVLNVDGVNGYVNCGSNSSLNITGPITISAWVKPGTQPAYNNYIVAKYDYGANKRCWALCRHVTKNKWFFIISPNGQTPDFTNGGAESNQQITLNQWVHLTCVFDGTTQKLYVNGVLQTKTSSGTGIYNCLSTVTIGTNWNNGSAGTNYFNGKVDDVRIYNYALSQTEITHLLGPELAYNPTPQNNAVDVSRNPTLSWLQGDYVQDVNGHLVYFGTSFSEVNDANMSSSAFKKAQSSISYNPGSLNYNRTYYWRIDEVNGVNTWKGKVWQFTTMKGPDIIAWWKFEGNANDSSSYGNNGTLINDANIISDAGDGLLKEVSQVLSVDGVDGYVNCGSDSSLNITGPITIAAWVKPGTQPAYNNYIVSKYDYGANKRCWALLRHAAKNKWFFIISPDGQPFTDFDNKGAESNQQITLNQWVHLTCIFDGNTQKLYVNGVLQTKTSPGTGIYNCLSTVTIGTSWNNGSAGTNYFNGKIDNVHIYNYALTADQISHIMRENPGPVWQPSPANQATNVEPTVTLSWSPGDYVQDVNGHLVYLGTDFNDVNDANMSSSIFKGAWDSNSCNPGSLYYNTTYYWRVDEVNGVNTWKGKVWQFQIKNGPGLVGWWKFESNAADSSGYGNHGNLLNGAFATLDTGDSLMDPNYVLSVDGVDDYVNCGNNSSLNITGPITITAWVKPNIEPNLNNYIVSKYDYGTNQRAWALLRHNADNKWFFAISPDGQLVDIFNRNGAESDQQIVTGQWVHLAAVFNGSIQTLYVNGALQSKTYNVSGIHSCSTPVTIGTDLSNGSPGENYFNGKIDDVRIYSYALSAVQIATIMRTNPGAAWKPEPVYGATNVDTNVTLIWSPGDYVQDVNGHLVYLGTDFNDVNDANMSSSAYKGTWDSNLCNLTGLYYDLTYYWRVDEVNGANTWKGKIWTFKTKTAPVICPLGDLNGDCKVNYEDLSIFCQQWLNPSCPQEGLVGHWKLDGDANDSSGSGRNASIYGSPTWVDGARDEALSFNGTGDYALAPDVDANSSGGMSWSVWLRYETGATFVLDQREDGIGYQPIYIGADDHIGDIQFYSTDTADANYFDTNLLPATWYHVAVILDDNTVSCYVNGSPAGSKPDTQHNFGTKDLHIATRYSHDTGFFKGLIDDVRIYNLALNETQIDLLAHSGPDSADLDDANGVNFVDFALLANNWMEAQTVETISFIGSPTDVGQKWGQLNAQIIISDMQQYYLDPAAAAGISQQTLIERGERFVEICQLLAPHWLEEFRAVANAAGVDPNLYVAYVGSVYRNLFMHECTSYSVSSNYTLDNAIFFHKNRDNVPKAQAVCIIDLNVPGINKFITITDGSAPSCMMMVNEKGLAGSADYGSAGSAEPRYRGMMNTYILRYIAERASSCSDALGMVQMFVDQNYYAGGDVGGTHWLFVDNDANILEVWNNTEELTYQYHNSDKVYSSIGSTNAFDILQNTTDPINFHIFHNVSRDSSICKDSTISGMTVDISRTDPQHLTIAWVTMPAKGLAFPLFMGGEQTPLPLVNGEVDFLFRPIDGATSDWESIETGLYTESKTIQSQAAALLSQGRHAEAASLIDHWVSKKTKDGIDAAINH